MKIVTVIAKLLAALAAVVGGIYLLATYGEQIVAWCKKVMTHLPTVECEVKVEAPAEEAVEEPAAEEEAVEEVAVEEVPVEEVPVEEPTENEVVADEADFAE